MEEKEVTSILLTVRLVCLQEPRRALLLSARLPACHSAHVICNLGHGTRFTSVEASLGPSVKGRVSGGALWKLSELR